MHISCPRCSTVVNARDYNLFDIWTCKKCDWRFRGVHANQPHIRNLINSYIAPFYTNSTVWDLANCPYCGSLVDLNWIGTHTLEPRSFGSYRHIGYNGPYVCKRCCRDLPWEYPEQFEHVVKEFNESISKSLPDQRVKEEPQKVASLDYAKMAQDLYKKKHNL